MRCLRLTLLLSAFVLITGNVVIDRWPTTLHYGDSNGYYLHLLSFWHYQDVGDYSKSIAALKEVNPRGSDPREDVFGIRETEKGKQYIKYTLGVPLLETPFYWLAHWYASWSPDYAADGWSAPYMFSVCFGAILYILWGLWLLMVVLRRYFSPKVIALVIFSLVVATNLFYQATYVTMAHGFLFFLHSLLVYLSAKFYDRPTWWRAFSLGLAVGLIALTRVPEILVVFVPLLWGVTNRGSFQERLRLLGQRWWYIFPAAAGFLLAFSPQLIYWFYVSGQLVFNPYQGEGFDLLNPHIFGAFFSYKNGWLIYTPIMIFSLLGLYWLKRYSGAPFYSIVVFVGLHIYVHFSYYAWWYFPGLGQRPMVDVYPLLAFGLAATYAAAFKSERLRWIPMTAVLVFGSLNLFQTWQSRQGIIWSEAHNGAFYWATFGRLSSTANALRSYDTRTTQPDEKALQFDRLLFQNGFETFGVASTAVQQKKVLNGENGIKPLADRYELLDELSLSVLPPGTWIRVGIHAYQEGRYKIYDRSQCMGMIVELYDEEGVKRRGRRLAISPHIGNPEHSIWSTGDADQWGEAYFFVKLPFEIATGWTAKVYLDNPHGQQLYLDDFTVGLYQ